MYNSEGGLLLGNIATLSDNSCVLCFCCNDVIIGLYIMHFTQYTHSVYLSIAMCVFTHVHRCAVYVHTIMCITVCLCEYCIKCLQYSYVLVMYKFIQYVYLQYNEGTVDMFCGLSSWTNTRNPLAVPWLHT